MGPPAIRDQADNAVQIHYQYLGLNPRGGAKRPLDKNLAQLGRLIPISSASIVLAHQRQMAPSFSATVGLAVPGPDIHAAARDHTLQAALLKVIRRLERQIAERKHRQQLRLKRREHCRAVSSQWSR